MDQDSPTTQTSTTRTSPTARTAPGTSRGASFRRAGVVAVVACAVTGSALGLGAAGAFATDGAAPATSSAQVAADAAAAQAASTAKGEQTPAPKITYSQADLAAFAASPYADDALNLAVVWGTPDVATAKGKAGAAITAGTPLPFGPDDAPAASYTDDQQLAAFFLGGASWQQALGLAVAWGEPSVYPVKSTIGATLLAHEEVPAPPATFTEDQQVAAFSASGYTEANAAELAAIWQSGSVREAEARAGAALLAGDSLPVVP
ncbi:hypothetical protein EDF18_3232 [Frigoribacterium sp. PhB107]|uniref:hypothetical protein n=1 Tax=Frigoribacterium sp. PhB107 TaxID=2485172 RepID=UPI000F4616CB|nr:hypothetical protein [Frigoribacterium sp. PhB107]ROP73007.1 hypothetical protein EDF18_3232 [Frigoribacterium sp. PhB107]